MIKESSLNLAESMANIEKVEVTLIFLVVFCSWLLAPELPIAKPLGTLLMWLAALLLMQSLIRDLWYLRIAKQNQNGALNKEQAQATKKESHLCIESAVGIVVVVIGAALLLSGLGGRVVVPSWGWPVAIFTVLLFGLLVKGFVIGWRPWRIQHNADHINTHFKL